jgi:hypothetical protein
MKEVVLVEMVQPLNNLLCDPLFVLIVALFKQQLQLEVEVHHGCDLERAWH